MTLKKLVARMIPAPSSKKDKVTYWLKLETRCGCTREQSFGISPPTIRPIWNVPLLRKQPAITTTDGMTIQTQQLEIREFVYERTYIDGNKVYYVYAEKP